MNESVVSQQIGIAFAASCLIEALKRSPFPWFSQHSDQLNRFVSLLIAAGTAIGLTLKMSVCGGLEAGGTFRMEFTFPALAVMLQAAVHFAGSAGLQEVFYRAALKPNKSAAPS